MLIHLPASLSDSVGSALSIFIFLLIFGFPLYPAWKSAQKGVSREEALLPCAACKSLIPATAKVCPYCRRSAGHDIFSSRGKKMDENIKGNKFLKTYMWTLFVEFLVIGLAAVFLIEVLGFGK